MSEPVRIAGVVPASGASRRMGRAKAAMELEGRSFVQRVVDALRGGGCSDVVIVVGEGDEVVESAARATDARVLTNPDPGEGPITSMRLALAELGDEVDGIAWLPVDYPLVSASIVRRLIQLAGTTAAPLVLPVLVGPDRRKRGHPPILMRALFPELLDPGLEGGARIVVHRHLTEAVLHETTDAGVVTDVDTPAIYDAIVREHA